MINCVSDDDDDGDVNIVVFLLVSHSDDYDEQGRMGYNAI
jgi:hypothetical protein